MCHIFASVIFSTPLCSSVAAFMEIVRAMGNYGLQKYHHACKGNNFQLSLPMYYGMTEEQIQYVIGKVNEFQ